MQWMQRVRGQAEDFREICRIPASIPGDFWEKKLRPSLPQYCQKGTFYRLILIMRNNFQDISTRLQRIVNSRFIQVCLETWRWGTHSFMLWDQCDLITKSRQDSVRKEHGAPFFLNTCESQNTKLNPAMYTKDHHRKCISGVQVRLP